MVLKKENRAFCVVGCLVCVHCLVVLLFLALCVVRCLVFADSCLLCVGCCLLLRGDVCSLLCVVCWLVLVVVCWRVVVVVRRGLLFSVCCVLLLLRDARC